jgi:small ligand-binding sensory domain FIST
MRCGHAAASEWRQAARLALERLRPLPAGANLGFLYFTDHFCADAAGLLEYFRRETGIADWVGTVGLGVLATGTEYLDQPAVAVLAGRFPEGGFRVFSGRSRAPALSERTASGQAVSHFAVVHGDPATADIPDLVSDMALKLESGSLVGGLACSRSEAVLIANEVLRGGLSGVVLSGDVAVRTGLTQGCVPPKGPGGAWRTHRITACDGSIVETLDGRPALEVFAEDIGPDAAADLRLAARAWLAGLPAGDDGRDFVARNIIGMDARRGLLAVGAELEQGMRLMFCRRDEAAAREDLAAMLADLRARLPGPPRGGLYISCIARGANMFGEPAVEMDMIRRELGDFPVVGFLANGEIARDRLYGYTGVLTVFV